MFLSPWNLPEDSWELAGEVILSCLSMLGIQPNREEPEMVSSWGSRPLHRHIQFKSTLLECLLCESTYPRFGREADILKKQDNLRSFWVVRKEMTFSEKHKIWSEYDQYKVLNCLNTCRWRSWFLLDWSGRSQKASWWSWYPAWPWNAEDFEWTRSWGRGLHERNTTAKA